MIVMLATPGRIYYKNWKGNVVQGFGGSEVPQWGPRENTRGGDLVVCVYIAITEDSIFISTAGEVGGLVGATDYTQDSEKT